MLFNIILHNFFYYKYMSIQIFFLYNAENPELVKPVVTIIDDKRLTIEYVSLEIAAMERKINSEIQSERCIPIINKVYKEIFILETTKI